MKKSSSPSRLAAPAGALMFSLFLSVASAAQPAKPSVRFVEPADGATVSSPVKVKFGLTGMELQPAGDIVANSGHHHVIVDGGPMAAGEAIPVDETHLHYGKAQTEAEIKLAPGTHKLTMQFANGAHVSYGPDMAKTITVNVK